MFSLWNLEMKCKKIILKVVVEADRNVKNNNNNFFF